MFSTYMVKGVVTINLFIIFQLFFFAKILAKNLNLFKEEIFINFLQEDK